MNFRTTCRAAFLACAILGLAGCETMQQTMASAREKISTINMPSFSGKSEPTPSQEVSSALADQASGCPEVQVVPELGVMHQFTEGGASRADNEVSSIRLVDFDTTCKRNENNVVVSIDSRFEGTLGPKAQKWNASRPGFAYPYFIAVTAPNGSIIAKEVFAVTVAFDKGQDRVTHEEHLTQIIPVQGEFGTQQKLMMGFQLTEADLAYNRALMGLADTNAAEKALGQNIPGLVFKGDPAVDKTVKKKKPKPKKVARPAAKPAAPIAAPAPASTETTPAAAVTPVESAPASPAPVAADPMAAPIADPFATPASAAMPAETPTSAPDVTPSPSPAPDAAATPTEPAPAAMPNAITSGDAATTAPTAAPATPPADGTTPPADPTLEDQTNAPQPPPLDDGQQSTIDITAPPPGE